VAVICDERRRVDCSAAAADVAGGGDGGGGGGAGREHHALGGTQRLAPQGGRRLPDNYDAAGQEQAAARHATPALRHDGQRGRGGQLDTARARAAGQRGARARARRQPEPGRPVRPDAPPVPDGAARNGGR